MTKISVYILAYNEEEKIASAINTVLWADEIVVVDSHSEDRTAEIAESMGARVVQVEFDGYGDLRNKAVAACSHDWIFSLDSDERCTIEVRDEILGLIQSENVFDAYYVPRKNFFMGRWIKHSGFYPNYRQPQLFRKGALTYHLDQVHEGFTLRSPGSVGYLKNPIWQLPFKNFDEILHKANKYSTLGAVKLAGEGQSSSMFKAFVVALWSFVQHYIMKRGVLDGWAGFMIALGNFEGTFYKFAKLYERDAGWQMPDAPPIKKEENTEGHECP